MNRKESKKVKAISQKLGGSVVKIPFNGMVSVISVKQSAFVVSLLAFILSSVTSVKKLCVSVVKSISLPIQHSAFNIQHFLLFIFFLLTFSSYSQTTVTLQASADAILDNAVPSTNFATQSYLTTSPWSPSYTKRFVIKFDLSSIPSGATVSSATLKLFESGTLGYTRTIDLHRLNTTWSEGSVTWNSPWTTAGGDYNSTASSSTSISWTGLLKQDTWNVTSDVQAFVNGTANNGWLVKDSVEDALQRYWQFSSKEFANSANRPVLEVTYTNAIAVEVTPASAIICSGASTTLTASGASTYSWSPATGLNTTTGATVIASPASTTTYTVTGTGNGGATATQTVTVTVNALPTVSISPLNATLISGNSVQLTASGASTYSWSPSTGLNVSTGSVVSASPSSSTTYTVSGTDANGCSNTSSVLVTVINPTLEWAELNGISWNSPTLTKTAATALGNASAFSKNHLNANQNGYAEFTLNETDHLTFGFAKKNFGKYREDVRYGAFVANSTLYIVKKGTESSAGAVQTGDVIKIEREGSNIKFYKNATLLETYNAGTSSEELFIDVALYSLGSTLQVATSFTGNFNAYGAVTDNNPGTATSGSIALSPLNAAGAVSYLWNTGATTSSLSNISSGEYSVTVSDAGGNSIVKNFTVLNKPVWTKLNSMSDDGTGRLSKTSSAADAWGQSKAYLPANQDGYVEFTATNSQNLGLFFGLTPRTLNYTVGASYEDIKYAMMWNASGTEIKEGGISRNYFSEYAGCTSVLKIARQGNDIVYYINGVEKQRTACNADEDLFLKFAQNQSGDQGIFRTSFGGKLQAYYEITDNDPLLTPSGAIATEGLGGVPPYTYSWSTGASSASINNLSPELYTLTLTDAAGATATKMFHIMNKAVWKNLNGMTLESNDILKKTAPGFNFSTGWGSTKNYLPAGQTGELVINLSTSPNYAYIGFSAHPILFESNETYKLINYAFYIGNQINIYEGGNYLLAADKAYGGGTQLKIARQTYTTTQITYLVYSINGTELRRVEAPLNQDLFVLVHQALPNSSLANIRLSFGHNLQASYEPLVHNNPLQTPSGSISVEAIGGKAPYTYSWSNGKSSASIDSLSPAEYTLTITDANSNSTQKTFSIGNKAVWTNTHNVVEENGFLKKQTNDGANTSWANSVNFIPAGEEGYVELTTLSSSSLSFGLSKDPFVFSQNQLGDILYGAFLWQYTRVIFSGYWTTGFNDPSQGGSLYRIERKINAQTQKAEIIYSLNNQEKARFETDINEDLYVKFIMQYAPYLGAVKLSHGHQLNASATITHRDINATANGAINVTPFGGNPASYTSQWQSGQTTEDLSALKKGNYSTQITDGSNATKTKNFEVLNEVSWAHTNNVAVIDKLVTYTGTPFYATSKNYLDAMQNGRFDFDFATTGIGNLGYTTASEVTTDADIKYGFYQQHVYLYTIFNGVQTQYAMPGGRYFHSGDKLTLERTGNTMYYKLNGVTIRQETVNPQEKLYLGLYSTSSGGTALGRALCTFGAGKYSSHFTNETCATGNGTAEVLIDEGVNYLYKWQPEPFVGQGTSRAAGLTHGAWEVEITDTTTMHKDTVRFQISNSTPLSWNVSYTNTCSTCNQGEIHFTASGGKAPYSYSIDGGHTKFTSGNFTNLSKGIYTLMLKDADSCYLDTVVVLQGDTLALSLVVKPNKYWLYPASGAADLTITGGTPPYTISWEGENFESAEEDLHHAFAGNYMVYVQDALNNGAIAVAQITNEILWADTTGIDTTNQQIIKTSGTGWNSGFAVSSARLDSSELGAMYLQVVQPNALWKYGFSAANDALMAPVAYGFYNNNGTLEIIENGVSKGDFGSVAAGDKLAIIKIANVIMYQKNNDYLSYSEIENDTSAYYQGKLNLHSANVLFTEIMSITFGAQATSYMYLNLTSSPSGTIHNVTERALNFIYREEYLERGTLKFTIYNSKNQPVLSNENYYVPIEKGINKIQIDCLKKLLKKNEVYMLEVSTTDNQKSYLLFQNNPVSGCDDTSKIYTQK